LRFLNTFKITAEREKFHTSLAAFTSNFTQVTIECVGLLIGMGSSFSSESAKGLCPGPSGTLQFGHGFACSGQLAEEQEIPKEKMK